MSIYNELVNSENKRSFLQTLKNERYELFFDEMTIHPQPYLELLDDEDAKVRKLMFELVARTEDETYFSCLYDHYVQEPQQMIRGKLLKALEVYDLTDKINDLQIREQTLRPRLEIAEESKNVREELKVIQRIISHYLSRQNHRFVGFKSPVSMILTINAGHHEALMDSLFYDHMKKVNFGVQVKTMDLESILQCRLWHHLYFPLVKLPTLAFDVTSAKTILHFISACHEVSDDAFRFRIDFEDGEKSQELAYQLEQFTQYKLQNNIHDYEVEIRVRALKEGYAIYLQLMTLPDHRFDYRKYASSSSVSPSTAALMMYYMQDYVKDEGNVFDPMCNDGVVLAERCMLSTPHFALGLNMDETIAQKAKQNLSAFDHVHLVQRDLKSFKHKAKFNEIVTKLPSLNRVKDKESLESMYELFFRKVYDLADDGAIMGVLTTEAKLLESVAKNKGQYYKFKRRLPLNTKITLYIFEVKHS